MTFSNNIDGVKPSAVREIFKHTANPEVIPFALGNPDIRAFPVEAARKISAELFQNDAVNCLQYAVSEGYKPLRDYIAADLASKGEFNPDTDDVIITAGAQQVVDAVSKLFVNVGDTVVTEEPSFVGSLNTFRTYGAKLVGVTMDDEGINPDELEIILQTNHPKFVYLIPTFQNPAGKTLPLERRERILDLIYKYDTLLLEDNPYGELYYDGKPPLSFRALEQQRGIYEGRVIAAGSFSKTVAPGLRVGYLVAKKDIVGKATVAIQATTVHTNIFAQKLIHKIVTEHDYAAHLAALRTLYKGKRDIMLDALTGINAVVTRPKGGFFLWVTYQRRDSAFIPALVADLLAKKVAVVPGNAFYPDENKPTDSIRLCFSTPSEEQIVRGCEVIRGARGLGGANYD
jgi:2-aminoadipate transaminase